MGDNAVVIALYNMQGVPLPYHANGILARVMGSRGTQKTVGMLSCIVVCRSCITPYHGVPPLCSLVPIRAEPEWFGTDLFTHVFYFKCQKRPFYGTVVVPVTVPITVVHIHRDTIRYNEYVRNYYVPAPNELSPILAIFILLRDKSSNLRLTITSMIHVDTPYTTSNGR